MGLALVLLFVVVMASLLYLGLQGYLGDRARRSRWKVQTITREDGTLVVIVLRGPHVRVVRELPTYLEGADLAGELREARDEAQLLADELNLSD